jgi:hypothetical protein
VTAARLEVRVVRRMGSDQIHVAEVDPSVGFVADAFGSSAEWIPTPVAARCGVVLRDRVGAVVSMRPGSRVSCRRCRTITGVEVAPERVGVGSQ